MPHMPRGTLGHIRSGVFHERDLKSYQVGERHDEQHGPDHRGDARRGPERGFSVSHARELGEGAYIGITSPAMLTRYVVLCIEGTYMPGSRKGSCRGYFPPSRLIGALSCPPAQQLQSDQTSRRNWYVGSQEPPPR